jgi:RNA polymerase sigma-70 factor (ECF subfamily)
MSTRPLDTLLERLASGDAEAAGRVFVTYESYLRMVVRRHLSPSLRAKFDSVDIVQSVWADVLRGFREAGWRFADATHLRAFLVRLTRDRFIDRLRQHRRAVERELPLKEGDWEQRLFILTEGNLDLP